MEQRRAVVAAVALLVTMLLPWYTVTSARLAKTHLNAFEARSWVEAAIFLVSGGVCMILFFRAEGRAFHLPGGDGTVILAAGGWAAFLLMWRVFDGPDVHGAVSTGITWGFFFAFLAAGALTFAGYAMRGRAEPTRAQDPTTRVEPTPPPLPARTVARRPRRAAGPDAPTQIAGQLSFEEEDRAD